MFASCMGGDAEFIKSNMHFRNVMYPKQTVAISDCE